MSFAMFAAPFNENENNENHLMKKKQAHNKTQKTQFKEGFDSEKVNSVLEKIHNDSKLEDDENNTLGEFNPPPMPESTGVTKTKNTTEHMMNMSNEQSSSMFRTLGRAPQPNYNDNDNLDLNNYNNNYGDSKSAEEYYKNVLPKYLQKQNFHQANKPYYNNNYQPNDTGSQDVLLQKLNYMITLLEEQQDEKTNNVTEEVVLYSFLGIFIIFIVDSFAKVGKYVR
jgi:hypothetical protein